MQKKACLSLPNAQTFFISCRMMLESNRVPIVIVIMAIMATSGHGSRQCGPHTSPSRQHYASLITRICCTLAACILACMATQWICCRLTGDLLQRRSSNKRSGYCKSSANSCNMVWAYQNVCTTKTHVIMYCIISQAWRVPLQLNSTICATLTLLALGYSYYKVTKEIVRQVTAASFSGKKLAH
jgi:hypothetical protein